MAKRRTFTAAFKAGVAKEALRGDKAVRQIAVKHGVHPNQVSQWKRKASEGLVQLFERGARAGRDKREAEIRKLHEKIGQLVVERDFLICPAGHIKSLPSLRTAQRDGTVPNLRSGPRAAPPAGPVLAVRRERRPVLQRTSSRTPQFVLRSRSSAI